MSPSDRRVQHKVEPQAFNNRIEWSHEFKVPSVCSGGRTQERQQFCDCQGIIGTISRHLLKGAMVKLDNKGIREESINALLISATLFVFFATMTWAWIVTINFNAVYIKITCLNAINDILY